jgi:hypothetical protein
MANPNVYIKLMVLIDRMYNYLMLSVALYEIMQIKLSIAIHP